MTPPESPLPFWTLVAKLQRAADSRHLDSRSRVADRQLGELLARDDRSDLSAEDQARFRRQTRYRRRQEFDCGALLRAFAARRATDAGGPHTASELTEDVRRQVSRADWRLLTRLADGASYDALAAERGVSTGTLKSQVSRLRADIRRRCPVERAARR